MKEENHKKDQKHAVFPCCSLYVLCQEYYYYCVAIMKKITIIQCVDWLTFFLCDQPRLMLVLLVLVLQQMVWKLLSTPMPRCSDAWCEMKLNGGRPLTPPPPKLFCGTTHSP